MKSQVHAGNTLPRSLIVGYRLQSLPPLASPRRWDQSTGPDHSGSLKLTPRSQVLAILILIATVAAGAADPIAPGPIDVIDGDTIRAHGRSVRLVGFDAPESRLRAQCESERALAAKATFRVRQLVSAGGLDLELVPCACRSGTEGTPRCNHGRTCGVLTAAGKDVGEILISEGLARRYVCGRTSCPRREPWCR
jgi:hypothetical protein